MPWVRTRRRRRRCLLSLCIHTPRTIGTFVKKTPPLQRKFHSHHFSFYLCEDVKKMWCQRCWKKEHVLCQKKVPLHHKRFLFIDQCIWLALVLEYVYYFYQIFVIYSWDTKFQDFWPFFTKGAESLCYVKMSKKTSEIWSSSAVKVDFVTKIALTINILDSEIVLVLNRF